MTNKISILIWMFIPFFAQGQELNIKLNHYFTQVPLPSTRIKLTPAKEKDFYFENIPKDLDTAEMFYFNTNRAKGIYLGHKKGKITDEVFKYLKKELTFDTTYYKNNLVKDIVFCYSGFKGNKKVIIFDANNNYDFADDQRFEFDTTIYFDRSKKWLADDFPVIFIEFEARDNQIISRRRVPIHVLPYMTGYGYSGASASWYRMVTPYIIYCSAAGSLDLGRRTYFVGIENPPSSDFNTKYRLIICPSYEKYWYPDKKSNYSHMLGDTVLLADHAYVIQKVSFDFDQLTLLDLGKREVSGVKTGLFFPAFKFNTLENEVFFIEDFRGKPVVINFWDSWCMPCIKEITQIKALWENYGQDIHIISMAFDDNPDAAQSIIKEQGMHWHQVILPKKDKESLALQQRMRVESFPTMLLLDKNGMMVDRVIGVGGVGQIQDKVTLLIKE
jgi:thiol-disulfide isomerase/thioredoxin